MKEKNQHFHVGLKAFIRRGKRLLVLREFDLYRDGNKWELPGGRIRKNELRLPLKEVLKREIREELGDRFGVRIGNVIMAWRRLTHPYAKVFLVGFDARYQSGKLELSDEHIEAAWITKKDFNKYKFADGYKEAIGEYFKIKG